MTNDLSLRWFVITGEYPPQPGGISDYTQLVAAALAAAGDEVEVWTGALPPSLTDAAPELTPVRVHRTAGHFGRRARAVMSAAIDRLPAGTRVLVQYEPWSFGYKGINLPFAWWLRRCRRRRPDLPLTIMFHEVATDFGRGHGIKQSVHGLLSHAMAGIAGRAADRVYMSVLVWGPILRSLLRADQVAAWLPVPSNVPRVDDLMRTAALRDRLFGSAGAENPRGLIVGHFSTFRGDIPKMLARLLPQLLASPACAVVLLLGRGGEEFAAKMRQEHPQAARRLIATGELEPAQLSEHLAACDLLVQPYPDGVSSRRSTVMAGLNLGCPIVTNVGHCSDPDVWADSGAVRLVPSIDPDEIARAAVALMEAPDERAELARRARSFYDEQFSLTRSVNKLRAD